MLFIKGNYREEIIVSKNTVIRDERTEAQQLTHTWGVVARDTRMSGWGGAEGGTSWCAWACDPSVDINKVFEWVEDRSDMLRVEIVDLDDFEPPKSCVHFHIYVCDPTHPAAR